MENNFRLLNIKDFNCLEAETKIISTSIMWLSCKGHLVMLKQTTGTHAAGCQGGRENGTGCIFAGHICSTGGRAEQGAQQKPGRGLPAVFFLMALNRTHINCPVIASHDSLQTLRVIKHISLQIQG